MTKARIEPGDLLHVIVTMRQLLSAYDNAAFVTSGTLQSIDSQAEDIATTLRVQLRDTANGIADLLVHLETLPAYQRLRLERLE